MPCPSIDRLVEITSALKVFVDSTVSVPGFLKGCLVERWLDTDLEDERKLLFMNAPRLHPRVRQSREYEVSEVERQLGDDGKNADAVDEEPDVGSAAWPDHF